MSLKRYPRLLAAAALALSVAGAQTAVAQGAVEGSAAASSTPVAGATTIVRATTSGVTDLVVPQDATFTKFVQEVTGVPSLDVSGNAKAAGIHLVRAGSAPATDVEITAIALPRPNAGEAEIGIGSKPREDRNAVESDLCSICRVPAGRYRLYALTDGEAVTITIKLAGLTGVTEISGLNPVDAGFGMSSGFTGASTDVGGYAGTFAQSRLNARGIVISLDYFDTQARSGAPGLPAAGVGDYGLCSYPDGVPEQGVLPGCVGGVNRNSPTFVAASLSGGYGFSSIGIAPDAEVDTYTSGAYATHVGLPFRNAGSTVITLPHQP